MAAPVTSISDLGEDENSLDGPPRPLVEVYLVAPSAANTDMVYELYFPLVRVERQRDQLVARMAPVGMLALGTLSLSQLPLAIGLARRVSSIRQSRQRLLAQTVKAVELERQRLAQELHDDVIQDLSGVAVTLESLGRSDDAHSTGRPTAPPRSCGGTSDCFVTSSRTCSRSRAPGAGLRRDASATSRPASASRGWRSTSTSIPTTVSIRSRPASSAGSHARPLSTCGSTRKPVSLTSS